ncbi:MAG: CPBP family intramembrane metalloprotease [Bacteroidales bacterium]|nr:CPBP family intramembrane metalloprotease [Bacteroidales bacterium]
MNTILLLTIIGLILCAHGFFIKSKVKKFLIYFIIFYFIDQFLTRAFCLPDFFVIGTQWNWTGKILSTLFSLIVILVLRKKLGDDFAFTLKQRESSLKPVLIIVSILVILGVIILWQFSSKGNPTFETHLFQLTMPGIAEELAFRGVFLGLLNNVFGKPVKIIGAKMGWGTVVTSILFGLWHGIGFDNASNFYFNFEPILLTMIAGFILAWLRERTGSLLIPVLFHNLINELGNIIMLIK